jgi:uncharacterized membrane-anchored protein YitT (DUF2179 family)
MSKLRNKILGFISTQNLKKYALLIVGCLPYALGVSCFYETSKLAPGGVSGIALILHSFFPFLSLGALIFAINIPILFWGKKRLGGRFLADTVFTVCISAVFTDLFSVYSGAFTNDKFLCAVAGGALVALGLGIVFRCGATTGGIDVAVKLLKLRMRHVNTSAIFLLLDGAVVCASWLLSGGFDSALYSAIALCVQTLIFDKILYAADGARLVYIISDKSELISARIRTELYTGATMIQGRGEHTGAEKEILLIVVRAAQLPTVRDIIKNEDSDAFVIITKSIAVFGKGYKNHFAEEL